MEPEVEVQDRLGVHDGRSIGVPGLKAAKSIPSTGDRQPWQLHAGSWTTDPQRGDVRGRTSIIGVVVPAQQTDQAARHIEETIAQLPATVAQQKTLIDALDASLVGAMPWIPARSQRQGAASDLLKNPGG